MALQLHEKISIAEARQWLLTAHEEWTGKHTESLDSNALEALEAQIVAAKPVDFKAPRKPRVSKTSTPDSERISAEYDSDKCDARIWLKGGFAAQCSCRKVAGQFLCKRHQNEADAHSGETKNGSFNAPKPTHKFNDPNNEPCWWDDQLAEWAENKAKKTSGKKSTNKSARGPRKCSGCGEVGHDVRKCPHASKASSNPISVAEAEALLAQAKAAEVAKAAEATTKPAEVAKPAEVEEEATSTEVVESVESSDNHSSTDTLDEDNVHDYADGEDEDESAGTEYILDGVPYTYNADGVVFDDDFCEVGKWNGESIEFTPLGRRGHKTALDSM
tara:strand:- start:388 stop:1380 length:993 start_codon:yes stop_codon:yes gene_type:complete